MKGALELTSRYSGENSTVNGTNYVLDCQGIASDRGIYATVNSKQLWWCGYDDPGSDGPKHLEQTVEEWFEVAYNKANELGDADDNWDATIADGQITITFVPDEEELAIHDTLSPACNIGKKGRTKRFPNVRRSTRPKRC